MQRVAGARVLANGEIVGEIEAGLCVLLGVARDDDAASAERLANRVARLRVFENAEGKFDRSVLDADGAALVISNFTLIADTGKGKRPTFSDAAEPVQAELIYESFCATLREQDVPVETGTFGARMRVELVNDGPVTIILDS